MFVVAGKTVTKLEQVGSQTRVDKKRALEQVISPVPIIPSKHNVEMPGARATIRVTPLHRASGILSSRSPARS